MTNIKSDFAILDVKAGRAQLKKIIESGASVPVVIEGVLDSVHSKDDGVSREFSLRVTKVTPKAPVLPFAKVSETKAGDILVADGGFTCLSRNAKCKVLDDGRGLYIQCRDGRHGLDGQFDTKCEHYVGLYRAATR